jgi:NAD+ diphosphatase
LNPPPHVYDSTGLDRAADKRGDAAWLLAQMRAPESRMLRLAGLEVPVAETASGPRLVFEPAAGLAELSPERWLFLGLLEGTPLFVRLDPGGAAAPPRYVELREIGAALPRTEAGIAAYARALAHWHLRHRFCGACGTPTRVVQAGHVRRCEACGLEVFPRTDPAIIVLVTLGDEALLARSPRFPSGMYSTLAGFVEPGESLEAALVREVREEAGVEVQDLVYRSSQPWPFPQSLMIGFRATARSRQLALDRTELEDARWISRAELADPERCPIRLPRPDSIARFLIEEWLREGEG